MARIIRVTGPVLLAVLASILVAGCGTGAASPASCKAAMTTAFNQAMAGGKITANRAACNGLSDAVTRRLLGEVVGAQMPALMAKALAQAVGSSFASASPAASTTQPAQSLAANVVACKAYVTAIKTFAHSSGDSLTSAATFDAKLAVIDPQATGQLRTDLDALQAAIASVMSGGGSVSALNAASDSAYRECFKLAIG